MTADSPASAQDDLLSRARAFEFFQAIRLLRRLGPSPPDASPLQDDHFRVRPSLNLAFPASDIESIEAQPLPDGTRYQVTANFLGLYGSASPLPTFYTEDLIDEAGQDESVCRDFLDVIHQRLYQLFYRGWLKYRLFFQVAEERSKDNIERLFCLMGLGSASLRRAVPHAHRLLRYIGLFTQFPRSAQGLGTLLRDALGDVSVTLTPCIPRMAKIPRSQRLRLGRNGNRLGSDAVVGEEIADRMGKFRIQVGPLNQADFLRFTPGNPGYALLTELTELYIAEPFEYDVELVLAARQARTACLGDNVRSVLGVTTWVFSEESLGEVRTRFAVNRS